MAFRTDSQYLITGGEDFSCKLWELSSGKLTQVRSEKEWGNGKNFFFTESFKVLVEHEQPITAIAISEDGKHVLTGDKDGQAIVWSFKDGKNW